MHDLLIEKTKQSPEVCFTNDGHLHIRGVSNLMYSQTFYNPLFLWLEQFRLKKPSGITLTLEITYVNTAASLLLVNLLNSVNSFKDHGAEVQILWKYESDDEDMIDLAEDIQRSTHSTFILEEV